MQNKYPGRTENFGGFDRSRKTYTVASRFGNGYNAADDEVTLVSGVLAYRGTRCTVDEVYHFDRST